MWQWQQFAISCVSLLASLPHAPERTCLSKPDLPPFTVFFLCNVFFWAHRGKCVTWIAKQLNESCRLYISSSDLAVLQSPCPPQACWYVISSGLRAALRLQVTHHHPAGVVLGASVEKATAKYVNTRGEEKTRSSTELAPPGEGWGILAGCAGDLVLPNTVLYLTEKAKL